MKKRNLWTWIGIILLCIFVIPSLCGIAINAGTFAGIFLSLLFLMHDSLMVFRSKLHKMIRLLLDGICVICAVCFISASVCMIHACFVTPEPDSTLIVLGCGLYGEKPGGMLQKRIDAAYRYLAANPDSDAVLSGGQGEGETISEAEAMYRELTDRGIASERLYIEDQSTDTRENIIFSRQIIEENHLNDEISVVTSNYHEYRASLLTEEAGLRFHSVPAWSTWYCFPTFYLREVIAVTAEWFIY